MKLWFARLVAALSFITLAGCANMAAIQEFGKLSADAAGYTKLADEYASSPTRNQQYTFAAEKAARDTMVRQAAERRAQVERLRLLQKTLAAYMSTVADLAGDEVTSYDTEIGSLTDAAVAQNYISDNDAKAVKSILSIIASAATDFYRQRKLREVVEVANAPLQQVVQSMVGIDKAYVESLKTEQDVVVSYYRNMEMKARDDKQSALAEQFFSTGQVKQVEFTDRVAAVNSYSNTLETIGKAHADLYANRDKISDKEVQRQVRAYVKKIYAGYKAATAK